MRFNEIRLDRSVVCMLVVAVVVFNGKAIAGMDSILLYERSLGFVFGIVYSIYVAKCQ